VTGSPIRRWEDFTDPEWRRAYKLIEDIEAGAVEVEE
jgi:hypothetical protein